MTSPRQQEVTNATRTPTRQSQQESTRRTARRTEREASTDYQNDHQVLTFDQWCRLNNISGSTGKRVLASGHCEFVQLSERRLGITVGANRKYQQRMTRKAG
jgi:hypothetical protein